MGSEMCIRDSFKSIQNLKKLNQDINFVTNFGRDVEYYTGIVFEVFSGTKEIASGGRYDAVSYTHLTLPTTERV